MARYCVYKPKTSCPECGNPVILDGPLRSIDSPSCFQTLSFPPDLWKTLLEDAYNEYGNLGCGASLGITTKSPRITTCEYCQAENFLPDPLWRRLHPVKKRVPWYVRYG